MMTQDFTQGPRPACLINPLKPARDRGKQDVACNTELSLLRSWSADQVQDFGHLPQLHQQQGGRGREACAPYFPATEQQHVRQASQAILSRRWQVTAVGSPGTRAWGWAKRPEREFASDSSQTVSDSLFE
ncbi:unnamed protein product [Eretmochelys imbricata]